MLVVGCAKLERRDAVVALVAHAAALLTAYRVHASALWFAASASRTEAALAAINVFLWSVNLVYLGTMIARGVVDRIGKDDTVRAAGACSLPMRELSAVTSGRTKFEKQTLSLRRLRYRFATKQIQAYLGKIPVNFVRLFRTTATFPRLVLAR